MKYRLHAVLALSLTLAVVSAARAAEDKPLETPYYPLKLGSVWHYKVGQARVTMTVAKYEEFQKQLCARVETTAGDKVTAVEHVAVKEDGVYRYGYATTTIDPPVKFFQFPPDKVQTWDIKSAIGTESLTGTIKSGMVEQVTVAAGTYKDVYTSTGDCDASGTKITFTDYFARDVGMIKQVIKAAGQEVVIELEKFEPGK